LAWVRRGSCFWDWGWVASVVPAGSWARPGIAAKRRTAVRRKR
jgi:hypothetical protein